MDQRSEKISCAMKGNTNRRINKDKVMNKTYLLKCYSEDLLKWKEEAAAQGMSLNAWVRNNLNVAIKQK